MMKNKGYTLVEMLIVIAIMGILAGLSFATFAIVDEARCSSAVNTLNNQMSSCLIQTKAVSNPDEPMCMVIKKRSDGTYAIMKGKIDGSGNIVIGNVNNDSECEAILPRQISLIEYHASSTAQEYSTSDSDIVVVLQFVKNDGSVCYGAGQYDLYTNTSGTGRIYASIYVDAESGKHYVK